MQVPIPQTTAPVVTSENKPDTKSGGVFNSVPAWGSYLYQNFLLPAFSPNIASEWLNLNSPFTSSNPAGPANTASGITQPAPDYFSQSWAAPAPIKQEPIEPIQPHTMPALSQPMQLHQPADMQTQYAMYQPSIAGPSYSTQQYYATAPTWFNSSNSGIATSLLVGSGTASGSGSGSTSGSRGSTHISPSVEVVDAQVVASPSPLHSVNPTPHVSPKLGSKRRASSMDSDDHSHDEHEPEVPEGVERDGMIWGMRVEDYRALSARERKRVRNRISARTFRAKRKEHLSTLEHTITDKDLQIKLANDEALRYKKQVVELKKRLSKYEDVGRL